MLYRRSKGKPIFPRAPTDAQFAEKGCSGRTLRGLLSRIGGASNCLLVVVHDQRLVVTPQFPFNLMFLPEIYRLDFDGPTDAVTAITPVRTGFRKALRIEFEPGAVAPVELIVRDEAAFVNAIGRRAIRLGSRDLKAPSGTGKSRKFIFMRILFAIWGVGALFAAVTGLQQDWRYRQAGHIAVATYANPDQQVDGQQKMGVLIYEVSGVNHRMASIWGVGLYSVGDREAVYYSPADPLGARESAYLHFDLLWLGLGLIALSASLFAGKIARRVW